VAATRARGHLQTGADHPRSCANPLGAHRAHEIANAYAVAFFAPVFQARPPPQLDGQSTPYPEATLSVS
jgi:hypothetical protein